MPTRPRPSPWRSARWRPLSSEAALMRGQEPHRNRSRLMLTRRTIIGLAAAAVTAVAGAAQAQDWKAQYPELTLGVIPAESASTTTDRYTPLTDYLSKELGVPVKLRVA